MVLATVSFTVGQAVPDYFSYCSEQNETEHTHSHYTLEQFQNDRNGSMSPVWMDLSRQ